MRFIPFFVLCFLLNVLSAQDTLYVYANSGLTMRETGSVTAEKVGTIPAGAAVVPTGRFTAGTELTVLASTPLCAAQDCGKSLPLVVHQPFVEVTYNGQTGFVYGGYLARYPLRPQQTNYGSAVAWLSGISSRADTLVDGRKNPVTSA